MHVIGLICRECGATYPAGMQNTCFECFGPLEVEYDWDKVQENFDKKKIARGPSSIWRYADLLPVVSGKYVDLGAGFNKLHRARNLGKALDIDELYVIDDSVNPSYSFKDRVTSVAISKGLEFNISAIGCASTGNLAAAVSAHAAKAGIPAYIFIPDSIERGKILQMLTYGANVVSVSGTYDDANRLVSEISDIHPDWGFVNINLRPFYTEGSKTLAFEVAEQLGWEKPDHVVVPIASGALLCAINRGYSQLDKLGLVDPTPLKVSCSQPENCAPVASAVREGREVMPVSQFETVAHSLGIGNPADGYYAKEVVLSSGGYGATPSDKEIVDAILLLARTEGIFTEPAGGTTVAGLKSLREEGYIEKDERVVIYVTGNGLKAQEAIADIVGKPVHIDCKVSAFDAAFGKTGEVQIEQEKELFVLGK